MEIKKIEVEAIDEGTRFVLKKIITDIGEFENRQIAISNGIYNCERERIKAGRPIFKSLFQTMHFAWDKKEEEWLLRGIKNAKSHAESNGRFLIPYKQRNEIQWESLDWKEAKEDFMEFKDKFQIVPFPIPLKSSFEKWNKHLKEAKEKLDSNQELIPILSSKHLNIEDFPLIIKSALKEFNLLGICSYGISDIIERTNLSIINSINSSIKVGDKTSLICYFDYNKMLTNKSYVAGSFAFNCFSGDVFSEKAHFPRGMSKESIEKMMNKTIREYFLYDSKEKKFTQPLSQEKWHGIDLNKHFMENIAVSEGLSGYNSIRWVNHFLQQKDLEEINTLIKSKKKVLEHLNNYSGWNVFWNTVKPLSQEIQSTL